MSIASDLKNFNDALLLAIKESTSATQMKAYGRAAIKLIIARTRLGYGVKKTNTAQTRLAPLAEPTKEYRRRNASKLHPETSPNKSNLTFTGQLLDSLGVKSASKSEVIIAANRRRRKGGITNDELAGILETRGRNRPARPFLNLSTKEIQKLNRDFSATFAKALKKSLKQ